MKTLSNLPALTTAQMIEVDRLMIEEWQISLIQMMENAGRNLAELTRQRLGGSVTHRRITVLCGSGNNGGGGMVAARHLHNWGAQVNATLVSGGPHIKEIPAHQWRILQNIEITASEPEVETTDLILDAMIGYGISGNPRPPVADWIARVNASSKSILALDAPSGLDATTGRPSAICIRAAATLTLALPKIGLLTPEAGPFVGELYLADISVPSELYAAPSLNLQVTSPFHQGTIVKLS